MKLFFEKLWASIVTFARTKSKAVTGAVWAGVGAALSVVAPALIHGTPVDWSSAWQFGLATLLAGFGIVYASPANKPL